MIEAFKSNEIDVGIGLTEAWLAGHLKHGAAQSQENTKRQINMPYHMTCHYTLSPLRWALSTGAKRDDISTLQDLKGKNAGISRFGSGSHIMACVLADKKRWVGEASFKFVEVGPFASLREAVDKGTADFFMWEHFTTKKYFDDGTLKKIGEVVTPWPGWHIVSHGSRFDERVAEKLLPDLRRAIHYFAAHKDESIDFICSTMEYSRSDAEEWYKEVRFPYRYPHLEQGVIRKALRILAKAGLPGGENKNWLNPSSVRAEDALFRTRWTKFLKPKNSNIPRPPDGLKGSE